MALQESLGDTKIELIHPDAKYPIRANYSDAGWDVVSLEKKYLAPGETHVFKLGLLMEIPEGFEVEIYGRSSLATKGILAHKGTIDHLYRKEVGVIMHNISRVGYEIDKGDKIAQLKIRKLSEAVFCPGKVEPTERGGFGSTGR